MVITYDPVGCQVWLDPMEGARGGQPLCTLHAERLHAPRGWVVLDRRAAQAVLRAGVAEPAAPTQPPSAPRRRWGQFSEPRLDFEEPVVVEPEPEPEPVAVEAEPVEVVPEPAPAAIESEPVAVEPEPAPEPVVDDLAQFFEPEGGLLGRAFRTTGRQRSVLTSGSPPPDDH